MSKEDKNINIIENVKCELEKSIVELFHTDEEEPYAVVKRKDKKEILPIKSKAMGRCVSYVAHNIGLSLSDHQMGQILNPLEAQACFDGEEKTLHTRIAETQNGGIEIDLNDDEGNCILVSEGAWKITEPVSYFSQPKGLKALPVPVQRKGDEEKLFEKYFHLRKPTDLVLLIATLTYYFKPAKGYPIIIFKGSKGSGKSTSTSIAKMLIDPEHGERAVPPKNEQDLFISASSRHVASFDNLSSINKNMSDALCRIATGGTFRKRELYSDFDETMITLCKPVILNGIPDLATKSDLISRTFVMELNPIANCKGAEKGEDELWSQFQADAPYMLGYLLDGLAYAAQHYKSFDASHIQTRFPDFAKYGLALEKHFEWGNGEFKKALDFNQRESILDNLSQEPLAVAIWTYFSEGRTDEIREQPTKLLDILGKHVGDEKFSQKWPSNAQAMSNILSQIAPDLKEIGIDFVGRDREASQRYLIINKMDSFVPIGSTKGTVSNFYDANDDHFEQDYDEGEDELTRLLAQCPVLDQPFANS